MPKPGDWTVWTDYGTEGWRPTEFESSADTIEFIVRGAYGGYPIRVTREVGVSLTPGMMGGLGGLAGTFFSLPQNAGVKSVTDTLLVRLAAWAASPKQQDGELREAGRNFIQAMTDAQS